MIIDTKTVAPELFYCPPKPTYEVTGTPPISREFNFTSDNANTIIINKQISNTTSTNDINSYEVEYTNYKFAASLRLKSDMTTRKEFKLIFSDLFDMLSNKDIALYDSLLASINVKSSSLYVLQSILRLSYTYRKELDNWKPLLIATKNKYLDDDNYNIDIELNGLFT